MARKVRRTPGDFKADIAAKKQAAAPLASPKPQLHQHPLGKLFRKFTQQEMSDLIEDIHANGQAHPIILFEGRVLDGWHRYMACLGLNIEPLVKVYEGSNPAAYVCSANLQRRHHKLTTEQKRDLIARVLKENPELSDRQVAKITKTSHPTVAAERRELEGRGKISTSETRTDTKGRQQPAKKSKPAAAKHREQHGESPPMYVLDCEKAAAANTAVPTPTDDVRAAHTVVNGEPRHGRGSGESTTSATNIAKRLIVDLIVHGVNRVDPKRMAQIENTAWWIDHVAKIRDWLSAIEAALPSKEGAS